MTLLVIVNIANLCWKVKVQFMDPVASIYLPESCLITFADILA